MRVLLDRSSVKILHYSYQFLTFPVVMVSSNVKDPITVWNVARFCLASEFCFVTIYFK